MPNDDDPFDTLLSLEDGFFKEGYDLGVSDGSHAGLVEGRTFGLEKGFEKYAAMGMLHGRAMIWAGRLADRSPNDFTGKKRDRDSDSRAGLEELSVQEQSSKSKQAREKAYVPRLQESARLETHVRTLYALTEPGSLSTENNEDSVSEFDDRLKRADGKVKIIEKLTGGSSCKGATERPSRGQRGPVSGDMSTWKGENGSIEDINSLSARH